LQAIMSILACLLR